MSAAFGVPGLGLKRGLEKDVVIAPYATGLAANVHAESGGSGQFQAFGGNVVQSAATVFTRRWISRRVVAQKIREWRSCARIWRIIKACCWYRWAM